MLVNWSVAMWGRLAAAWLASRIIQGRFHEDRFGRWHRRGINSSLWRDASQHSHQ